MNLLSESISARPQRMAPVLVEVVGVMVTGTGVFVGVTEIEGFGVQDGIGVGVREGVGVTELVSWGVGVRDGVGVTELVS